MGDLEVLFVVLLVLAGLSFLTLWSFLVIASILLYSECNKEFDLSFYGELNSWEVLKFILKILVYGPFAYKIFSKYQKEKKDDD